MRYRREVNLTQQEGLYYQATTTMTFTELIAMFPDIAQPRPTGDDPDFIEDMDEIIEEILKVSTDPALVHQIMCLHWELESMKYERKGIGEH